MGEDSVRIGVAGLGFMGATHLGAYRNIAGAGVAAVASSDERKLAGDLSKIQGNLESGGEAMDFSRVAKYSSPEELFADPNLDAVDLCVPTYLHAPLARKALEAGKHVLVEKPMALTAAECEAMAAAAKRAGRVLMTAQVIRFWPDYVAARRIVRSGELGPVRTAWFRRKCAAPGWGAWLPDKSKSGGGVFDLLIHDVDYCLYLFGRPRAVSAMGVEDLAQGVDQIEARFEYPQWGTAVVSGGWHHSGGYPFSMEFTISCEAGTLDFHLELRGLTVYRAAGTNEQPPLPETGGFQAELERFVRACREGRTPEECPPEDSALAVKMTLAMCESRARGGERVEI